jgi:FkbM family methyltransferase
MITSLRPMKIGHITHEGRVYPIRYPDSGYMEQVMQGIFGGTDYPRIDCLTGTGDAIVDIGANIGCTAMLFRMHYANAPIYAFEPCRESYEFLAENAALLGRTQCFHCGLFDRDATTALHLSDTVSVTNSISASIFNTEQSETITLRRASTALDEAGIDRIAILKVDTEGAEIAILRDLEPRFDRIDAVFVEYHSDRDRLEIEHLMRDRFILYFAHAARPHLGTMAYVARDLIASNTDAARFAIARPLL